MKSGSGPENRSIHNTSSDIPAATAPQAWFAFACFAAGGQVDLNIGRGGIYGFLGPNDAGKPTTVRVLATLLVPTAGRAVVAGYGVATQLEKVCLSIRVVLQEAALVPKGR